jgi:hypothetical protein
VPGLEDRNSGSPASVQRVSVRFSNTGLSISAVWRGVRRSAAVLGDNAVSQDRTRAYTVYHRGVTAHPNPVCKLTLVAPYSW